MPDKRKRKRGEEITHKPTSLLKCEIIFFCEGDTEKLYFPSFNKYENVKSCNIKIKNQNVKHNDAEGLVRDAAAYIKENPIDESLGDIAYCVFDSDPLSNPDEKLKRAIDIARRFKPNPIEILFSNPCIEVWYYMHYDHPPVTKDAEDMKDALRKKIDNYTEKTEIYGELIGKLDVAMKRAKMLHDNQSKNYENVKSHECKPYSNIFEFVEYLNELIKRKISER